jgi:hypothetical protein
VGWWAPGGLAARATVDSRVPDPDAAEGLQDGPAAGAAQGRGLRGRLVGLVERVTGARSAGSPGTQVVTIRGRGNRPEGSPTAIAGSLATAFGTTPVLAAGGPLVVTLPLLVFLVPEVRKMRRKWLVLRGQPRFDWLHDV